MADPARAAPAVPAKLGIIAGGGDAPQRLAEALERTGRAFFLICLEGQADPALAEGRAHAWLSLGAAAKARDALREQGVGEVIMLGRVRRPSLAELKPDWLALQKLPQIGLGLMGDDGLLQAISKIFAAEGFRVVGVHEIFSDFLAPAGVYTKLQPDDQAQRDIRRGIDVARKLGEADAGQSVVVQQGIVLGLEAVEGTDALLQRAGIYKREGEGGVLVKCCKPKQDRRFDLPTVGTQTVQAAAAAGLRGIAIEAGRTLIFDREAMAAAADAAGLFVFAFDAGGSPRGE
ncbi:MAG: DUF1009 domain-containing protein [Alphaproteobacteria bacterium]|nr:DUF1009 domain-containing protein [Alphaproteobacteria bacterium]